MIRDYSDWLMSEDYTDRIIVKEKIISDIKDEHYKNLKENKNGK